jgi:glycosyltransferase involved in cell wall biosynthesis
MKLLFIHEHRFFREGNAVYSGDSFPYTLWINNYLPYFDSISVIGKQGTQKDKRIISSVDDKVNFILISYASAIKYYLYYLKIKKIIREEIQKADVVAVRLPSSFGYMAISILAKKNKPFFVEQVGNTKEALWNHGSIVGKLIAHYFHWVNKKCIKKSPNTIYVAQKLQKDYPTNGYAETISDVILPRIINREDIQNSRFNSEIIKIGLIGGFTTKYKGQNILLKAVSQLDEHTKENIELYFIGYGDYAWLSKLANQLNLKNNIKFIGALPHDDIFNLLKDLSLYVQPSFQEGMPRAMLEAMSVGCPVLGSTIGGIPDILESKFLHKPGDYNRLAEQIKIFYNDRDYLLQQAYLSLDRAQPFIKTTLAEKRSEFFKKIISNLRDES